ncbi:MAG: MBL fold metallo-hydrolase [Alphaproteobacteria bacterium]|nr:MBL fold metallo-hydrolase [Alphaproteobacteria bacterium]
MKPDVRGFFDPATATWTYVVWSSGHEDRRCAIIDSVLDYDMHSGRHSTASADAVIDFVKARGLEVEWILETHIHADHLTAAHYLRAKLGGKIAISRHILAVLETWAPVFQSAEDTPLDGSQFDVLFEDDQQFTIGPMTAKMIHTPGHTPADTSYIVGDAVFVGDAMFLPDVGSGRCDFPGGNAGDSYDSGQKLLALPPETRMYVGHDYPPGPRREPQCMATVSEQRAGNLRFHQGVTRERFIEAREAADAGKGVPELILPSLQVNLRTGQFGKDINGVQFVRLPVDKL